MTRKVYIHSENVVQVRILGARPSGISVMAAREKYTFQTFVATFFFFANAKKYTFIKPGLALEKQNFLILVANFCRCG